LDLQEGYQNLKRGRCWFFLRKENEEIGGVELLGFNSFKIINENFIGIINVSNYQ
jgi:hypothetical protein